MRSRHRRIAILPLRLTAVVLLAYSAPLFAGAGEVWRGPHSAALEAHRQHPVLADLIGDGTRSATGMKYYAITGDTEDKQPYQPAMCC